MKKLRMLLMIVMATVGLGWARATWRRRLAARIVVSGLAFGLAGLIAALIGLAPANAGALAQALALQPGASLDLTCSTRLVVEWSSNRKAAKITCVALPATRTATRTRTAVTRTPTRAATHTPTALAPAATATSIPPTATFTPVPPTATFTSPPPSATPPHHEPTATATAHHHEPTATAAAPVAGQPCPESLHDPHTWHAPVHSSGCYFGHEHGDAPPNWVAASRWAPMFSHPGNTPNENVLKHTSFKGFTLTDDGVALYVIMHLDTNPNGHSSRFHSYQAWARDASGAVSYWDLWADFGEGNNTGPNVRPNDTCDGSTSIRPIMGVNHAECPLSFESWYSRAGAPGWGWDFGFNVKAQYYHGPRPGQSSNPDLTAVSTWLPTGNLNDVRRIEAAWYEFRAHPTGTFYSTQFGDLVSGPSDPVCGTTRTYGEKSYTVLCLEQYIAPTMTSLSFPGNSVQKEYDMTGVNLPN